MENKTKIWYRTAHIVRRLYHTLNNYKDKTKDIDFRAFSTLEYDRITSQEVKDLKRLDYIKRLDLAKKGYIDADLKNLLARAKEKERLVHDDHKIVPIGNFKILESDTLLCSVKFGFRPNTQTFFMADNTHDNIPLWKTYNGSGLQQSVSTFHPAEKSSLQFEHSFYGTNPLQNEKKYTTSIVAFYNDAVQLAFQGNPYFKTSILLPNEQMVSDPMQYVGKQFDLSEPEGKPSIMTLTDATERYLVFQSFLETAPKAEALYFSTQEFKERFLDGKIELIAYLKHGLKLGIEKGTLYIGRNKEANGCGPLQWETFERRMQSSELSAKEKYYLSKEVISKKNFFVETDAILLKSDTKEVSLKKHYGTGQWHFVKGKIGHKESNFRPVDVDVLQYINQNYSQSKNFRIALTQLQKNQDMQTMQMKPS